MSKDIQKIENAGDKGEASNLGHYGSAEVWIKYVVKETGLRFSELIKDPEKQLINKSLISSEFIKNPGLFPLGEFYRLTSLGHHVCTFISDYGPEN